MAESPFESHVHMAFGQSKQLTKKSKRVKIEKGV